ncbi:MAG: bifunctional 3-deoxy-7-phosphoheptulonate synthase/chorismate mutase [Candidatus Dormibacteria bacterium]
MEDSVADLSALRERLDSVDAQLVDLIAERFNVIASVAAQKQGSVAAIRDHQREREVLEGVERTARARGVPVPLVRRIFEELLSQSVIRQAADLRGARGAEVRVGFQGVEFAYSHLAAQKYMSGRQLDGSLTGFRSFAAAVDALLSGDLDLVVAPIENTTAGSITEVYNLLRERELSIVGEETWKADHCLAGVAEVPLSALERILSHPMALDQCSEFIQSLPHAIAVPHFDTSGAMRFVAEQSDAAQAAIGSAQAADAAGLVILRRSVANQEENHTRFVVLAQSPEAIDPRVPCKTSLIIGTRHEQGALLRCLEILSGNGLSMTKLESRPRPGRPWEYMFFIDIMGNIADQATLDALDEVRSAALHLKVLGSYPATATSAEPQTGRVPAGGHPRAAATVAANASPRSAPAVKPSKNYRLASRATRPQDTVIRVGNTLVGGDGFVVMAGPCAVESAEQVDATARAVRDLGAHILRGGVFKPRTSPYAFQGRAWEGLDMLHAAGRAHGLPIISEVMAVEQVARMTEKVDVLQVGARNMQNFDLLRELGKVDRPVLLKRGLSSTIEEWLGAAEYILSHGNQQVILCERGIRTFESATRNTLDLSAVCVLRERTHLPVIVDPSHGTGYRPYVAPMARAARAVGAHGVLIEVHPDPDHALSDAEQSLSFADFAELMRGLSTLG